jgi:hypothetical protein
MFDQLTRPILPIYPNGMARTDLIVLPSIRWVTVSNPWEKITFNSHTHLSASAILLSDAKRWLRYHQLIAMGLSCLTRKTCHCLVSLAHPMVGLGIVCGSVRHVVLLSIILHMEEILLWQMSIFRWLCCTQQLVSLCCYLRCLSVHHCKSTKAIQECGDRSSVLKAFAFSPHQGTWVGIKNRCNKGPIGWEDEACQNDEQMSVRNLGEGSIFI